MKILEELRKTNLSVKTKSKFGKFIILYKIRKKKVDKSIRDKKLGIWERDQANWVK